MPHIDAPVAYEPLDWYPHLGPADADIWRAFVERNPGRFMRVWYDFHVGDADEEAPIAAANVQAAWVDLTRWRCDVIAEDVEKIYVIEIKPHANAKAIGQALSYAHLFVSEHAPSKPVVPVVLTDLAISTTRKCAASCGVEIWEM